MGKGARARYRDHTRRAPVASVVIRADGRIVDASGTFLKFLDMSPDSPAGEVALPSLVCGPDGRVEAEALLEDAFERGWVADWPLVLRRGAGPGIPVQVTGTVVEEEGGGRCLHAVLVDLSERRLRETQRESLYAVSHALNLAADLDDLGSSSLDAIARAFHVPAVALWLLDAGREGQEVRLHAVHGFPSGTRDLVSPRRLEEPEAGVLARCLGEGGPVLLRDPGSCPMTGRLVALEGRRRLRPVLSLPLLVEGEPEGVLQVFGFRWPVGDPFGHEVLLQVVANEFAVAVGRLRRIARLEEENRVLRRTRASLVQAGKMTALWTLSAGLAHGLSASLASVKGFLSLVRQATLDPSADPQATLSLVREHAGYALRGLARMEDLVARLRGFARQPGADLAPLDIRRVIEGAVGLVRPQFSLQNVVVREDTPPSIPRVSGNADELVQVLLHLLMNARDSILAARHGDGGVIRLVTRRSGGMVEIAVTDDGAGVPPEVRARLFEPFCTTREGSGLGLGLAISQGIVHRHGGTIRFEEPEAGGARFVVSIPAVGSVVA